MKGFSKNSVIYSFIKSYICISIAIILLFIPFMSKVNEKIIDQNAEINKYVLHETKQLFDRHIDGAKNCCYAMAYGNMFEQIVADKNSVGANQYAVYEYRDYITDLMKSNSSVSNICVLLKDDGKIISPGGIFTVNEYFNIYYGMSDSYYRHWINMLYTGKESFLCESEEGKKFTYKIDMSKRGTRKQNYIVFSEINESIFQEKIEEVYNEIEGSIIMLEEESENYIAGDIYSSDDIFEMTRELRSGKRGRYIGFLEDSSSVGWSYGLMLEKKRYLEPVTYARNMMLLSIALGFIIACAFSWYFSRKNYTPIKKIIKKIQSAQNGDGKFGSINELEFLNMYTRRLTKQNTDIMRNNAVFNILNEIYSEEDIQQFSEYYSDFINEGYIVALVRPDEQCIENLKKDKYKKNEIQVIFINILEELLGEIYRACVVAINSMYCCILNTDNYDENKLKDVFEKAHEFMQSYFNIEFSAAVGSLENGYGGMGKSYGQASEVMRLASVTGVDKIMFYRQLGHDVANVAAVKNKITAELKTGKWEKGYDIFLEFMDSAAANYVPIEIIMFRTLEIMSSVASMVLPTEDMALVEEYDSVKRLVGCTAADDIKKAAYAYFRDLTKVKPNADAGKKEVEVCKFINENYMDINLSVGMISDEFSLHPVYLSRMFKEKLGKTLIEYITSVRMTKAKELLSGTSYSVKEIASKTGYTSVQSFSRAFKNHEGVPPGSYRGENA